MGFWYSTIFSDECSIERGAGHRRPWVWRYPEEKMHKNMTQPVNKSKDIKVMVWAAICNNSRSDLICMRRDTEARKGYTAESYMYALELGLPSIHNSERLFQQDNAPIHKARKTMAFFRESGIKLLENWPPYSLDLNPIEHLWPHVKQKVYELYPELSLIHI